MRPTSVGSSDRGDVLPSLPRRAASTSAGRTAGSLDLGCGAGIVAEELAARTRIWGWTSRASSCASRALGCRAPRSSLRGHVRARARATRSLDAVAAFWSIIHVPRRLHADALRSRMQRWLRPGGLLFGTLGSGDNPDERRDDFFGAPMYWSHFDAATNRRLLRDGGVRQSQEADVVEDMDERHLWVIARPDARIPAGGPGRLRLGWPSVSATILDGRAVAAQIRAEIAERVMALVDRGIQPGLAAVLVGNDEASRIYLTLQAQGVRRRRDALRAGRPPLVRHRERAARDDAAPEPRSRDPRDHRAAAGPASTSASSSVQTTVDPAKDVDGLHPLNVGLMVRGDPSFPPATPYGIVELLLRSGVELEGAEVVVVGYGELVGAPLSMMLAQDSIRGNATVTICHIKTRDLAAQTRRADILVAAAGRPHLITADMVKPGAVVVDVGVHRTDGGLVGDVRFDEVKEVAGAITPVPGGVGPMTTAMLLAEHGHRGRGVRSSGGDARRVAGSRPSSLSRALRRHDRGRPAALGRSRPRSLARRARSSGTRTRST